MNVSCMFTVFLPFLFSASATQISISAEASSATGAVTSHSITDGFTLLWCSSVDDVSEQLSVRTMKLDLLSERVSAWTSPRVHLRETCLTSSGLCHQRVLLHPVSCVIHVS